MAKPSPKDLWFYSNTLFFLNYTLVILKLLVTFPLPSFPSSFNCLFLLLAYILTFKGFFSNFKAYDVTTLLKKIFTHPNTSCIALFLCFVPNLLLLPFYPLSLYHIVSYIVSKKEAFSKYFFYNFVIFLNTNIYIIGRSALFLEILLVPVAGVLLALRKIGVISLTVYLFMIRQQYISNSNMKAVVIECMQVMHSLIMKLPDSIKMRCLSAINYIRSFRPGEKPLEKKE